MSNIKKVIKIDFLTATTSIEKITTIIFFWIALAILSLTTATSEGSANLQFLLWVKNDFNP